MVLGVPQLGGDEEILALQTRDILVGAFDAGGDLALVLVDGGQVEMTVAGLTDLTGFGLPGTKAQLAAIWVSRAAYHGSGEETYGSWAPELRVTFLPRDMVLDEDEQRQRWTGRCTENERQERLRGGRRL